MALARIQLAALVLEYEAHGEGEPVLLIHGGVLADAFAPLLAEPALGAYRLVRYRREGYGGSGRGRGPPSIREQAAHARALASQLGIARAHVVGHSSGASIALQLARDASDFVASLVLLEPVLPQVPAGPAAAQALELYARGEPHEAVFHFSKAVCGAAFESLVARVLPDGLERAVTDAEAFFGRELPALLDWRFDAEPTASLTLPILAALGEASDTARGSGSNVFAERHRLLLRWFPHAESCILPGVSHLMLLEDPAGVARCLAEFVGRSARAARGD